MGLGVKCAILVEAACRHDRQLSSVNLHALVGIDAFRAFTCSGQCKTAILHDKTSCRLQCRHAADIVGLGIIISRACCQSIDGSTRHGNSAVRFQSLGTFSSGSDRHFSATQDELAIVVAAILLCAHVDTVALGNDGQRATVHLEILIDMKTVALCFCNGHLAALQTCILVRKVTMAAVARDGECTRPHQINMTIDIEASLLRTRYGI